MPTENEFKYVLSLDSVYEIADLASHCHIITQGYLTDDGSIRIRKNSARLGVTQRYITFKRKVNGRLIEIETEINQRDYNELLSISTYPIYKNRYFFTGFEGLVVDFLHDANDELYFVMAEWEVAEDVKTAPELPEFLKKYLLYQPKQDDYRFTNFKLSSPSWAKLAMGCIIPWKKPDPKKA